MIHSFLSKISCILRAIHYSLNQKAIIYIFDYINVYSVINVSISIYNLFHTQRWEISSLYPARYIILEYSLKLPQFILVIPRSNIRFR